MKVIAIDNFNRNHISDRLIKSNLSEEEAEKLAEKLNEDYGGDYGGDGAYWFYEAVPDDHKLHVNQEQ